MNQYNLKIIWIIQKKKLNDLWVMIPKKKCKITAVNIVPKNIMKICVTLNYY